MKLFTGPHAFGLISAPLRDNPASNGGEQRLTIDRLMPLRGDRRSCSRGPRCGRSRGIIRRASGNALDNGSADAATRPPRPGLTSVVVTVDYGDRRGEVIAN
jgi:hypothetical protein